VSGADARDHSCIGECDPGALAPAAPDRRHSLVAEPIVRSGNLRMMEAITRRGSEPRVLDALRGHIGVVAASRQERPCRSLERRDCSWAIAQPGSSASPVPDRRAPA
jgi:hypothetical protein